MKTRSTHMLFFALVVVALLAAACETPPEAPPEPAYSAEMIAEGETLFVQTCSACHGPDAKGVPNLGKDLTTSEFVTDNDDDEMFAFVLEGRPSGHELNTTGIDMPPRGGNPALTDAGIRAIIAFMRSIHVGE